MVCARMMSLASQTLTASGVNGTSGTIAVLLATDFATALATLLLQGSFWARAQPVHHQLVGHSRSQLLSHFFWAEKEIW